MSDEARTLLVDGLTMRGSNGQVLVDDVSFEVRPGECLAIVGESGSGKTLTVRGALGLSPRGVYREVDRVVVCGDDSRDADDRVRSHILGMHVGYVPQNTLEYLHPLVRVKTQMTDGYMTHHDVGRHEAVSRAGALLEQMGIRDVSRVLRARPAQLSGGMRQRVNIATALMGDPELIVADEPTAALDVVTQRRVADLLVSAARDRGAAVIMVSHSLGLVRAYADRVLVMHAGRIVEGGSVRDVCLEPGHPYTQALIDAVPVVGSGRRSRLREISGWMPEDGRDLPTCTFATRCPLCDAECQKSRPDEVRKGSHQVFCRHAWQATEGGATDDR